MNRLSATLLFVLSVNAFCFAQGGLITLNLSNPTNPSVFTTDPVKGHWTQTYSNNYPWIEFGLFKATHIPGAAGGEDVGGGMSYWDGFTYCTSGDKTDYGQAGSSDAWVAQQWGNMAGGGIATDGNGNVVIGGNGKAVAQQGVPYLVAYWGYWMELFAGGDPCLQMKFTDGKMYEAVGIYINNHPWPFYGNIHGDGFARPFNQEGDYFKLFIHGMDEHGNATGGVVEHTLAEYKNGQLIQSPDWEYVNLSTLGAVSGIYFTMETTDADPIYGPNTAVYFCMDKLQVRALQQSTAPTRPTGLNAVPSETTIALSWNASDGSAGIKGYNLYRNGTLQDFTSNLQYAFTGLSPYTEYQLEVEAVATDNTLSDRAIITVRTTDETAPAAPTNLTGTTTEYTMALSWNAATDNVGVTEYHIYLNGERQRRVTTTNHTLTGLDPATAYLVEVEARDAAGNSSPKASITLTTAAVTTTDVTPPTAPTNLSGIATENTMTLSWSASTDDVGVAEYHIYLNGELKATVTETFYIFSGIEPATTYLVEVEAHDAAGNSSPKASITLTSGGNPSANGAPEAVAKTSIRLANGIIYVENPKSSLIQIYTISGRSSASFTIPVNEKSMINISSFPNGIYIIKNDAYSVKIIK